MTRELTVIIFDDSMPINDKSDKSGNNNDNEVARSQHVEITLIHLG